MMISFEDCVAMCGLSREEIAAIAEHEHIPEMAAAALGNYLLGREHGLDTIRDMIVDDIREASAHGNRRHAGELLSVLRHLLAEHPGLCCPETEAITI